MDTLTNVVIPSVNCLLPILVTVETMVPVRSFHGMETIDELITGY